jgi:4-hydroxyphenylpyruvate dioxygenase-like putative hemolysin
MNVRGMSEDQIVAVARQQMNDFIAMKLLDAEDILRSHGATKAEIAFEVEEMRTACQKANEQHLEELRACRRCSARWR